MNWDDPLVAAAETDTGMRRSNNQDSHALVRATNPDGWRKHGHLFVVADGMGAHAVGELASKMACEGIPHTYRKLTMTKLPAREAIVKAYQVVGGEIHAKSQANKDFAGMGTTCSALIALPEGVLLAHVGDSRIYRTRGGTIDQLTFDHSLAWELRRGKYASADQVKATPKNVITRSLGPEPSVEVDLEGPYPVELDDVFLLCSDGLSGPVKDEELGMFMAHFSPKAACRYLLHLANLRGGLDNITVAIVRFGAWSDLDEPVATGEAVRGAKPNGARRNPAAAILAQVAGMFRRKPAAEPVEEHLYRSADANLSVAAIEEIEGQVRKTQQVASDQNWEIDWSELGEHRREADAALSAGDLRAGLRHLGECVALLGFAGRWHKKSHGAGAGRNS